MYLDKLIPPAWWKSPEKFRALYEGVARFFKEQLKETEEYLKDAVETSMQPQMQIYSCLLYTSDAADE